MPATPHAAEGYDAAALIGIAAAVFQAVGVPEAAALTVSEALVEADLEGVPSHGLLMLPMYVERIVHGSVATTDRSEVVSARDGVVILDGGNSLGQLVGDRAMRIAVERAREFGAGIVGVRAGFHFGTARRYSAAAAAAGCIGIAMCNTRPLMAAPGGAERLVGTNPISIALPTRDTVPLVLDVSFAEAAMNRIRMAAQSGRPIPPTWATGPDGLATTDPQQAIEGMLLPAAGHKGFGMSVMIDLLSSLLAGGAWGAGVQPLFGDPAVPYDCSQLFIAIDVAHARPVEEFAAESEQAARRIRESARAAGVERIYTPGEPEFERRQAARGRIAVEAAVVAALHKAAAAVGVDAEYWLGTPGSSESTGRQPA